MIKFVKIHNRIHKYKMIVLLLFFYLLNTCYSFENTNTIDCDELYRQKDEIEDKILYYRTKYDYYNNYEYNEYNNHEYYNVMKEFDNNRKIISQKIYNICNDDLDDIFKVYEI